MGKKKKVKEPEDKPCVCPKCGASVCGGFEIPMGFVKCIDPDCGHTCTREEAEEAAEDGDFFDS